VQNGPNQTARDLLFESEGINQATLVWRDIETDLLCKGRPDRIIREYDGCPTTADFKTSVKPATEHRRGGYLMDYWCHTQAAMYRSGLNTIAGSDALYRRPVIVMVEAAPNSHHGVVCLAIDEDTMDQGDRQYRRWLNQYAECVANDHWPSYPDGLTRVSIPRWGFDPGVELHGI